MFNASTKIKNVIFTNAKMFAYLSYLFSYFSFLLIKVIYFVLVQFLVSIAVRTKKWKNIYIYLVRIKKK